MAKKEKKDGTKETITLMRWLISQIDGEAYRRGTLSGERHPMVDQKLIRLLGGQKNLLSQARELERDIVLGQSGKIRFEWRDMNMDIKKIHYFVDIMPELCRREGIEDPRCRQLRYISQMKKWKEKAEGTWLAGYYAEEICKLERGLCSLAFQKDMEDEKLYQCLDEMIHLQEPVEKRIFSARVFRNVKIPEERLTPSKIFGQKYESKVITILKHSPEYADGMSDDELLKAHGILSYTQTLEWKGPLIYLLDGTVVIDASLNRYGTILGTQTLEHAMPKSLAGVKKIIVIENKANYEKMQYQKDVLYIFCHGFFSPKEVRFLKTLKDVADAGTEYWHWGDLDYGGIRIYQFNKENVFPELRPYKMSKEDYIQAMELGAGVEIDAGKKERLAAMDAGELEELKKCILEFGQEIEQELLV